MGSTSNRGLPYPGSSDLVTNGAQAIQDLADALDAAYCIRSNAANPTIPNNALTTVAWATNDGTSPSCSVDGAGVITVNRAGRYDISGAVRFNANATGRRAVSVLRNGATPIIDAEATPNAAALLGVLFIRQGVLLNAGDTITVQAFQASGAGLALVGGVSSNYVSVVGR